MTRFCIILGAMKAGTTSLFNYLAQHPQIAPCNEKEPSFFSHYYEKGLDWYLSLWKDQSLEDKVLLEASTNYTKYPSFPDSSKNIIDFSKKHDVSIKLIYVMRDPIKRIESQHTYAFARWTSKTLAERIRPNGHLINVSRYAQQLDLYSEVFGADDLLLIDFDDLKNNTSEVLVKTCDFLRIDTTYDFADLHISHNPSEGARIVRPVEKTYRKFPWLKKIVKSFPWSIRKALLDLFFRKRINRKFKLTESQKQKVHDALQEDMTRLHKKYGVNISKWGFQKKP